MSGKAHYWREKLRHLCHPLEEHMQFLPEKPSRYREVIGSYSVEARKLSLGLLELICEGLGLESGFFGDELTQVQVMALNHYPPCPDPSITLGLLKHSDSNLLTLLIQNKRFMVFKSSKMSSGWLLSLSLIPLWLI